MIKLKWKVDPKPTGLSRVVAKRSWPMATYAGTEDTAARLTSDLGYSPSTAESVWVYVWFADYRAEGFTWRKLSSPVYGMKAAKARIAEWLDEHEEVRP